MANEKRLTAFEVANTGDGCEAADIYALTETGVLLRQVRENEWREVPQRGEYLVIKRRSPMVERW